MKFKSTAEVAIPKNFLDQVIGQDEAVAIAKAAARQHRHLLLVAPPGTGKSMIARAMAELLPKPSEEISVLHNPQNPERPVAEVRTRAEFEKEKREADKIKAKLAEPSEVPSFVAERLGFRCRKCNSLSKAGENSCPKCGFDKKPLPVLLGMAGERFAAPQSVHTTRVNESGKEEVVAYERVGEKIRVLNQTALEKLEELQKKIPRKIIVPLERNTFVLFAGASETELLGDVLHDPFGGHAQAGTPPFQRVVAGAVHEAHQGVLFIDELSTLGHLQRFILTAMQERKYAIAGRNPQSAGAIVRVDDVPCDFILVAASNINDLQLVLPPLRSRIAGNGYEVLLETFMPATQENEGKLAQFAAQEVVKDGRIPHASHAAFEELVAIARAKAKQFDDADHALTLRLRELSGVIRLSGDLAAAAGSQFIEPEFVRQAAKRAKTAEQQMAEKFGSVWRAGANELAREAKGVQKEVA